MVDSLHLLDLRIRPFNMYVAGTTDGTFSGVGWSAVMHEDRGKIFKPIYIPTYRLNPYYYLYRLMTCAMYIVPPTSPLTVTDINLVTKDYHTDPTGLAKPQYAISGGDPVLMDATNAKKFHFVIWRIGDYESEGKTPVEKVLLGSDTNEYSGPLYEGREIETANSKGIFAQAIDSISVSRLGGEAEVTRIKGELANAVKSIGGDTGGRWYLPTITRMVPHEYETDNLMGYVHAGIPMSLADMLALGGRNFPGGITEVDANSGPKAREHADGKAVDVSLAPYYAMTGIVLKPHSPYILSPKFNVLAPNDSEQNRPFNDIPYLKNAYNWTVISLGGKQPDGDVLTNGITIDNQEYEANTKVLNIPLNGLGRIPGTSTQSIFDDAFSEMGTSLRFDVKSLNDLDTQEWWHFKASSFGPTFQTLHPNTNTSGKPGISTVRRNTP